MAPGLPAVWPSRCAVCLLVTAGAALGPLGGTAHWSSAADGPSVGATPSVASSPAATPSPSNAAPSSALPSAVPLPLPSGARSTGALEPGAGPSADSAYVDGAEAPAGSASPSPSRSASVEVSGSTAPLAGREAGAGKARPGRSLTPLELARAETPVPEVSDEPEETAADLLVLTPPPEASSEPGAPGARALDASAVRQVQQLSLGTGIALVGLGLGFLAFRLRRVN